MNHLAPVLHTQRLGPARKRQWPGPELATRARARRHAYICERQSHADTPTRAARKNRRRTRRRPHARTTRARTRAGVPGFTGAAPLPTPPCMTGHPRLLCHGVHSTYSEGILIEQHLQCTQFCALITSSVSVDLSSSPELYSHTPAGQKSSCSGPGRRAATCSSARLQTRV